MTPDLTSTTDPSASSRALAALRATPLFAAVMHAIHNDWISGSDAERAFLLCCFSELAYAALLEHELDWAGRYKLLRPAAIAHELARLRISLPADSLGRTLDVPLQIVPGEAAVYLIARLQQTAVIAVRGTFRRREWAINLTAPPVLPVGGNYHLGFKLEALRATARISAAIEKLGSIGAICFTGHSLGGGLAGILAQSHAFHAPIETAHVYACPRFGNARALQRGQPIAFGRTDDVVPRVPPRWMGFANLNTTWLPQGTAPLPVLQLFREWSEAIGRGEFAEQHQIELYRRDVGRLIDLDFPHDAYISALRQAFPEAAFRK